MTVLRLHYPNFQDYVRGAGLNSMVVVLKVLGAFFEIPWSLSQFIHIKGNTEDEKHYSLMHLKLRPSDHSLPVPTISLTHCMGLDSPQPPGSHPALGAGRSKWLDRASVKPI